MAATDIFQDGVFRQFAFYSAILFLKVVFLQLATTFYRLSKHIYANDEDVKGYAGDKKDVKIVMNDVDVERVRRCHQNDLENVIPFVLLGSLYVSSGPSPFLAVTLFRVFTAARIGHTVAYLLPLPQPSRTLCYTVGLFIHVYMALSLVATCAF